jgi:amino acid transporter
LSTLPANEIVDPKKTIPKAIVTGLFIVTTFYLLTNLVIVGTVDQVTLESSQAPLIDTGERIFGTTPFLTTLAGVMVGLGAIVSIMGADESGTIGTSRLAYAMSLDGLLPRLFSKLHPKYKTPYLGLILLCLSAFVASLMGSISDLINASVFLLSFAYLATCVSLIRLERMHVKSSGKIGSRIFIPTIGALFSILLISQVSYVQIIISLILMLIGVPVYIFFSPKKELEEIRKEQARTRRSWHHRQPCTHPMKDKTGQNPFY